MPWGSFWWFGTWRDAVRPGPKDPLKVKAKSAKRRARDRRRRKA